VEVLVSSGGFANGIEEYLHRFSNEFEHKLQYGGGSGDSGGSFLIFIWELQKLNLCIMT
jgi:hypothetical protein